MKQRNGRLLLVFSLCLFIAGSIFADQTANSKMHNILKEAKVFSGANSNTIIGIHFQEAVKASPIDFLEQARNTFGISQDILYVAAEQKKDRLGHTRHSFQPEYKSIPLANTTVLVHTNSDGIIALTGNLTDIGEISTNPALSINTARDIALKAVNAKKWLWEESEMESWIKEQRNDASASFYPEGRLVITGGRAVLQATNATLAYEFRVFSAEPYFEEDVFVDAQSGEILNRIPRVYFDDVPSSGQSGYNGIVSFTSDSTNAGFYVLREESRGGGIRTLDLLNTENYSAAADFEDFDNFFDDTRAHSGVNLHWATEATYDYFLTKHGRNSFDDNGTIITGYAHALSQWNNAQWLSGINAMRFGDGDGLLFNELTSVDVVSHEFSHGVTQYTAGLIYQDESGALNESFSDIFGAMVEFELLGVNGNWLIGEDVMANGAASLRSMSSPNAAGDPDTYFGNLWAPLGGGDNGGVHSNSGVQNFWFYLLSDGGSGTNDNGDSYSVTGLGSETAAAIAYRSLATYLTQSSGFSDARLGSILAAVDLYGEGSTEFNAVIDAWNAVGVYYPSLDAQVAAPSTINFITELGENSLQSFFIANQGLESLIITDVSVSANSDFQIFNAPAFPITLPDLLDSLELSLIFTPSTEGVVNGAIEISTNDPVTPVFTIGLIGDGYVISAIQEGTIYAVGGRQAGGQVFTVNQYTGTATAIDSSGIPALAGIDIRPSNGELYGLFNAGSTTDILRISANTGRAFEHINFDVGNVQGIAFDNNDDLFAINFTVGILYKVNPDDGTVSQIGPTAVRLVAGMAINPLDGQLWAISANGILYQIDKMNGNSSAVGPTGLNRANEILFDAEGKLYGIDGYENDPAVLVEIDPASGAATEIGPMGYSDISGLAARGVITGIEDEISSELPSSFQLHTNFPNPFNPTTSIRYDLPKSSSVSLGIYNSLGQLVRKLVSEEQSAGFKTVRWDGRNEAGQSTSSGIYLYRLEAGDFVQTRKMMLLK
ncbi:MAG: M4 family metallopeptidase [Calditrichia bacterium]